MAKRNTNKTLISRQTLSVGENLSEHMFIGDSKDLSFQVIWEGSPACTMVMQTSNDPLVARNMESSATWFTEPTTISGCDAAVADGSIMVHVDGVNSTYARMKLTVSVAGTITVYGTSKE